MIHFDGWLRAAQAALCPYARPASSGTGPAAGMVGCYTAAAAGRGGEIDELRWHASARVRVFLRITTAAVPPARDAGVLGRALDPDFQAAGPRNHTAFGMGSTGC